MYFQHAQKGDNRCVLNCLSSDVSQGFQRIGDEVPKFYNCCMYIGGVSDG